MHFRDGGLGGAEVDQFTLGDAHHDLESLGVHMGHHHHHYRPSHLVDEETKQPSPARMHLEDVELNGKGTEPATPTNQDEDDKDNVLTADQKDLQERYHKHVHRLPNNAGVLDYITFMPRSIIKFLERLVDAFGFKFTALVAVVYGLSQGLGETFAGMAVDYYLKDDMKLEPAEAQTFGSITHLPWTVKPIYGLISDTMPIFGFHRSPYIFIAGLVGTLSWGLLSGLKKPGFGVAALLVLLANYSISSPDVIIDAAVTERSQMAPFYAADLQSLSWGSHSMGGILGCLTVGHAQTYLGSKGLFMLTSFTAFILMILAARRWLPEKRLHPTKRRISCGEFTNQRPLYLLAGFVGIVAVILAVCVNHIPDKATAGTVTLLAALLVSVTVYVVLSRISPKIARPAVFFFIREAIQPSIGEAMFYWYTTAPEGPRFTPEFLGNLQCIAYFSMMVGIMIYNRYLSNCNYRKIFTFSQLLMVASGLLEYIFVKRYNLAWGISDKAFIIGDEALVPLLRRFATIPFFVLAAKVCPERCEATLFALLMALSNFGGDVGSYMGVVMLRFFEVNRASYGNLPLVTLVKAMSRFLPIFLIPFLVPDATPHDEILTKAEKMLGARDIDDMGPLPENGHVVPNSQSSPRSEEESMKEVMHRITSSHALMEMTPLDGNKPDMGQLDGIEERHHHEDAWDASDDL